MAVKKRHQNQNSENGQTNRTNRADEGRSKKDRKKDKHEKKTETAYTRHSIPYILLVGGLALVASYLHGQHLWHMFESDKHFSHLSTLERELAFRTEMGLYYSYYKTMIESKTFLNGLTSVMNDNMTEYPSTINTLKRFNLYPEVVLAVGYRGYTGFMHYLKKPTKICWQVNRGQGLEPVQSCEGMGEPSYFYVEGAILLNSAMMGVFFLFGTYLSGSVLGGITTVACFFYNHSEATRVQWTPPLRESFAYPFLIIQILLVTHVLKINRPSYKHSILIAIATICYMLPWQFAQFALLTQTVAFLGCYVLQYIGSHKIRVVLVGQTIGLLMSYVLLFGNEMLLTSYFAACLFTAHIIVLMEPVIEKIKVRPLIWLAQGILCAVGTFSIKMGLAKALQIQDDAHISDIFRSKFGNFKNFHTMLYTCAKEFDFMEAETPGRVSKTLLAPVVVAVLVAVAVKFLKDEYTQWCNSSTTNISNGEPRQEVDEQPDIKFRSKPNAEILYNVFQLLAFTLMAVIIMRLKLFWTPFMAVMASLIASRQFFGWIGPKTRHYAIVVAILGAMSVAGWSNLSHQWSIKGEYSNWPLEQMVEWIKANTPPDAVFCGPMPTMATVKLSANRPIVNHPHYEDAGLRSRTKDVYSMYSRKSATDVKQRLVDLKVDYAILEDSWCMRSTGAGCSMPEIWDLEDKVNKGKTPLCESLRENNVGPHFKRVFKNGVYDILKIIK